MTGGRVSGGTAIDRGRPIRFTFDGRTIDAFAGDSIASALLANGVRIVGRSFKYHRPRGVWGAWVEEPNAIVDVDAGGRHTPNVRATTAPARDGIAVSSVNASPTAEADRFGAIDALARFIPAAFYYKTFMLPDWHRYEPRIRAMAGLGRLDPDWTPREAGDQVNAWCDLLVVGAGPAGLAAASVAAAGGKSVILVDDQPEPGGSALHRGGIVDGLPAADWAARTAREIAARGGRVMTGATAFGVYDHGLVGVVERHGDGRPDTLWRIRPTHVVLAAGAIERPMPFADNDRPGVMSADAALRYLRRHGVVPGRRVVIATSNGSTAAVAAALAGVGVEVVMVDRRTTAPPGRDGVRVLPGRSVSAATGRRGVDGVVLDDGSRLACDALLVSGGWSPTIHLFGQARGRLAFDEHLSAFVPAAPVDGMTVVGAAAGRFTLAEALASGAEAAAALLGDAPAPVISSAGETVYETVPAWPEPRRKGRIWIDLQNDVTAKDVELAARENFVSVEHLKRYTTLGMANDQGKTSNLPGLALMAALTGRSIPEVGTTTYRPPYDPVSFEAWTGARRGPLMNPLRRLPLEPEHRAAGAAFGEYGGWLRPAWYGPGPAGEAIRREALAARTTVGLFDGSSLGKIEVIGPDAAAFLDFHYVNTMATLKPGRCRYGFMLSEAGIVYDDGILMRLDGERFVVSCSSSHVAGVHARLEEWRQDRFDRRKVFVHDVTTDLATLTVTGPLSRALVEAVGLGATLDDAALPHMAVTEGRFGADPVRIARVSFTGDRSYELSIRADRAGALWETLQAAGRPLAAATIGLEALMVLRAEKGYIVVGKDTDGLTRPADLGLAPVLAKKAGDFVGRRSLAMEDATRPDRRQFVGLRVGEGEAPLVAGAHVVDRADGAPRSAGYVTSSCDSPMLGRPIALGLVERGLARTGETVEVWHLGTRRRATIAPACAFDPAGDRLHA